MNYDITKGQLITLWLGGVAFWIYSIIAWQDYRPAFWLPFINFGVPTLLIFYTLGWRKIRKHQDTK